MWFKKALAYAIGFICMMTGFLYGAKYSAIGLSRLFGGQDRVNRLLSSTLPFKELKMVELIGIIIGAGIGGFLLVGIWAFIMFKTGWLTQDEIMKFIQGRK